MMEVLGRTSIPVPPFLKVLLLQLVHILNVLFRSLRFPSSLLTRNIELVTQARHFQDWRKS